MFYHKIEMIPSETKDTQEQVKHLLFYQAENLKDDYEDLEEKYYHLNLDFKDKNRLLEFLIRDFKKLAEQMKCLKVYLDSRKIELKNKLCQTKDELNENQSKCYLKESNQYCQSRPDKQSALHNEYSDALTNGHSYEDNEYSSLEAENSELLSSFQSSVHDYVHSLIDYKVSKLDRFKKEVLKIDSTDDSFHLIDLLDSLNGENLSDRLKNSVNYERQLQEHLGKLKLRMKLEKSRGEQLNEKSPIDLNNLSKLNVEKLNLNKLEDSDEDRNLNNILELKFALLKVEETLNKLRKVQKNQEKEITRYSNEKKAIETNIDSLKNDERKLSRELRDAQARIHELTSSSIHNQKMMEQLKKRCNE